MSRFVECVIEWPFFIGTRVTRDLIHFWQSGDNAGSTPHILSECSQSLGLRLWTMREDEASSLGTF